MAWKYLITFLVAHMIEILLFDDKISIMNYIYSLQSIKQGSFEWYAKDYFERNTITTKNFTSFITFKLNNILLKEYHDKINVIKIKSLPIDYSNVKLLTNRILISNGNWKKEFYMPNVSLYDDNEIFFHSPSI